MHVTYMVRVHPYYVVLVFDLYGLALLDTSTLKHVYYALRLCLFSSHPIHLDFVLCQPRLRHEVALPGVDLMEHTPHIHYTTTNADRQATPTDTNQHLAATTTQHTTPTTARQQLPPRTNQPPAANNNNHLQAPNTNHHRHTTQRQTIHTQHATRNWRGCPLHYVFVPGSTAPPEVDRISKDNFRHVAYAAPRR